MPSRFSFGLLVCAAALPLGLSATPANAQADACASATTITPGVYNGNTTAFTSDGGSTCQATSRDAWFKYIAPANPVLVQLTTCGSAMDTVLSLHSACPGGNGNMLSCDDDGAGCGTGSRLKFFPAAGSTTYIRVCGRANTFGAYSLTMQELLGPPDIFVTNISEVAQAYRTGAEVAILTDSPICNIGNTPLDWSGAPIGTAPKNIINMYRLKDDRLTQIGASWAKHSNNTSQDNWCSLGCAPWPNTQKLGPGCSDTYEVSINNRHLKYAPRAEINPWTGAFNYSTSFIVGLTPPSSDVERMTRVFDTDLNPATNAGALYFMETRATSHQDANHMDSLAHRRVNITGSPGGTWGTALTGATITGPITQSWPGASTVTIPAAPVDDGRCIVAGKARLLSPGVYRFEYAVYNHDMNRAVRTFSVSVGANTTITNIGSFAPRHLGEPGNANAWTSSRVGPDLVFQTAAHEATLNSNPIRWGMLYNFWFDATISAPVQGTVTLGMYLPGTPTSYSGTLVAPFAPPPACPADMANSSGVGTPDGGVDINDLVYFLGQFEAGTTAADLDNGSGTGTPDGGVDISDLLYFLVHFEAGC
jgi:hypothetical protein